MSNVDTQLVNKAQLLLPSGYTLLYLTKHGSVLYGTNSENSDVDIKGIFLPPLDSILLGTVQDDITSTSGTNFSRNSKDDTDISMCSLSKFLDLLVKGETGTIDTLFSMFRNDTILYKHDIVDDIKQQYSELISKKTNAFLGYTLNQTRLYGLKGKRYSILKNFWDILKLEGLIDKEVNNRNSREVFELVICNNLSNEHIYFVEKDGKQYLNVLGKEYEDKAPLIHFRNGIKKQLESYGGRAKASSTGTDFKALSHAVRIVYELQELLAKGFIKFPLSEHTEEIKFVKYKANESDVPTILNNLENNIEKIDTMYNTSSLQESVSMDTRNKVLLSLIRKYNFYKL